MDAWYFNVWLHDGICPNCGVNLKAQHPAYNVYPHRLGECANNSPKNDWSPEDIEEFRKMKIKV